ncbi:MAG TPA: hypothetical protein VKA68_01335, partial [bacterium]|nr:hypothetical protein [bacterium]
MSESRSNITAVLKTIGSLIKFTFVLLVLVISILTAVLLILYSMYTREKEAATPDATPAEGET